MYKPENNNITTMKVNTMKWVKWHTAKYGDLYSEFVLCIYPSKVHTHSSEHTHTHTHTPTALSTLNTTTEVPLKVERALYIHSPHLQSLPDWDLNSKPLDFESATL